jgi:hypothetical protein
MAADSTGKPGTDLLMVYGAAATPDRQSSLLEARGYGSIESDAIHFTTYSLNVIVHTPSYFEPSPYPSPGGRGFFAGGV